MKDSLCKTLRYVAFMWRPLLRPVCGKEMYDRPIDIAALSPTFHYHWTFILNTVAHKTYKHVTDGQNWVINAIFVVRPVGSIQARKHRNCVYQTINKCVVFYFICFKIRLGHKVITFWSLREMKTFYSNIVRTTEPAMGGQSSIQFQR